MKRGRMEKNYNNTAERRGEDEDQIIRSEIVYLSQAVLRGKVWRRMKRCDK